MSKRKKRVLYACLVLVAGVIIYALSTPRILMARLRAACASGDRLAIDTNTLPEQFRKPGHPDLPAFELGGTDKVTALLDAIEIGPTLPGWHCRCFGQALITVYQKDVVLARVSIHHDEHMRWRDCNWPGDQPLTSAGVAQINEFLKSNGCPTPAEIEAKSLLKQE